MKLRDINYIISLLLLISVCMTGATGYLQSQFELRKFIPHRYFAYTTLTLAAIHIYFNAPRLFRYLKAKLKKQKN